MPGPFRPKATPAKSSAPPVYRPAPARAPAPPVFKPVSAAQLKAKPTGIAGPPAFRPTTVQPSAPPVYRPNAPVQQRKVAGAPMLKPAMVKPAVPRPQVVQRTIVGTGGQQIWATEIAAKVADEKDQQISKEVHRLHSATELIPVVSYDDLVAKIKSGHYNGTPVHVLSDNISALRAVFSRLRDDPAILAQFPNVKRLYETSEPTWKTAGIREVLRIFIFLYVNAEVLNTAFEATDSGQERQFLEALNHFCINHIGCGVTGEDEIRKLVDVTMQLGPWLKEGLPAAESQLTKYSRVPEKYNDYVTDNLDNTVKAYFRKLSFAKAEPKEYDKSDSIGMTSDKAVQYNVLLTMVSRVASKGPYLGLIWEYIKDVNLQKTYETVQSLVDETAVYTKVPLAVDESDIRSFLREKKI